MKTTLAFLTVFMSQSVWADACDWVYGEWQCVEKSTQRTRYLSVIADGPDKLKMSIHETPNPKSSDEWDTIPLVKDYKLLAGKVKERANCNDGKLKLDRKLAFAITASWIFLKGADGKLTLTSEMTPAANFIETLNCQRQ